MERILKPYDKESMKKVMLKHEETFKEQILQVHELHRLYRVQKMLMNNMKSSGPNGCGSKRLALENDISLSRISNNSKEQQVPRRKIDLEQPAEEYNADEGEGVIKIEDESDIELTLGPACYIRRKKEETPLTSDSGLSFSCSSTESSHMKRTSAWTYRRTDTREELPGHEWGLIQLHDMQPNFCSRRKNNYDVEEQLRQEKLNQPPWLFHAISLNMT